MSALFYGPVHAQTAPEGESSEPPPLITAPQAQLARPAAPGADVMADSALDRLFAELAKPDLPGWELVEEEIWMEWSKSGSAAMDLLLRRGRDAMAREDWVLAIDHLTALIDHAPGFAEGYNARATAYFQRGLYGPALQDIRAAIALNPRHFGALSGLGIILEELDRPADALAAYRAVQQIHPHRENVSTAIARLTQQVDGQTL